MQKEVQDSVTELDRARFVYYTEESESIKTAERAEEAQLIAKGKKKAMMSMFKSQTALEQQAEKLSAKQEELNIKSTGLTLKLYRYHENHDIAIEMSSADLDLMLGGGI